MLWIRIAYPIVRNIQRLLNWLYHEKLVRENDGDQMALQHILLNAIAILSSSIACFIVETLLDFFQNIHDTMLYCVHAIDKCTYENAMCVSPHLNVVECIADPMNCQVVKDIILSVVAKIIDYVGAKKRAPFVGVWICYHMKDDDGIDLDDVHWYRSNVVDPLAEHHWSWQNEADS